MGERPIPLDGPEVRALLAGRQTQFRRVVKIGAWPDRGVVGSFSPAPEEYAPKIFGAMFSNARDAEQLVRCPYGAPGDRLWVRETWAPCEAKARKGHFQYAADGAVGHEVATNGGERWWERSGHTMGVSDERLSGVWVSKPSRWRPSIHMPRRVSRLTLEVTGVRVERLQDISEADAMAEGVERFHDTGLGARDGITMHGIRGVTDTDWVEARDAFCQLWESINGADSWASNPWVWAVEFKREVSRG